MKTTNIGRRAVLASAAAAAAIGASTRPAAAADIKLGFTISLTGGTDDFGRAARNGAELAVKEYNAAGGYKGQKVELVIYDDETKPAKGVENAIRLITRDRVFAIVGPANSGVALAMIDVAQKQKMPLMVPLPTSEGIIGRYAKEPKHYIYRVTLNDGIQTQFIIDYIKKKNFKRVALMHDSTGWGQSGKETSTRLMQAAGMSFCVDPQVFDQNDTDMTTQLAKIKEANAEFIISFALAPAGVQIAKSMQKLGMKTPWSGTWGLLAPNFMKLGGKELAEGVMGVTSFTPDHSENAKKFHVKIEEQFKDQGGDFFPVATAQTYDATRLVLKALTKAGPDPQKVRDALEQIDDFNEAVTKMHPRPFTPDNHEALGADTGFLAVWRDGKVYRAD
jgi:branched-chain amino acid transport system substrate-binding protein